MFIKFYTRIDIYLFLCVCLLCLFKYVCVCECVCECVWVCVCMCVCWCVLCVHIKRQGKSWLPVAKLRQTRKSSVAIWRNIIFKNNLTKKFYQKYFSTKKMKNIILKLTYGPFGYVYWVATLSKLYLFVTEIIKKGFEIMRRFWRYE